jgi:hydroxymethylglutaryl-CoA lyase
MSLAVQHPIKLVECPRDAMQGLHGFVPTETKAAYINLLLQVGFDTVDFGSFVSPKAIPQMRDTAEVLSRLDLSGSKSKLLAIVANMRGVEDAIQFDEISYLGFPFSISETFQKRNTNSTIEESIETVDKMITLCKKHQKEPVIYLSMGFGNPYGDEWSAERAEQWTERLVHIGATIISLADTTGVSSGDKINYLFPTLAERFPGVEFGVHLHSTPHAWEEKIDAAYKSGCRRFDSALKGFGGCPMAADDLTGNISTENIISYLTKQGEKLNLDMEKWQEAMKFSEGIF